MLSRYGWRRRATTLVVGTFFLVFAINMLKLPKSNRLSQVPILGMFGHSSAEDDLKEAGFQVAHVPIDNHPISKLMAEADNRWRTYEGDRSTTFKDTVAKYRRNYGRHPPPGFKEWYQFSRERHIYNIDDFEQIMGDLRPFWAIEPAVIRRLAAHMWEHEAHGISGIHIRKHKVVKQNNQGWRSETMAAVIENFIEHIPDMDIAMNRLDQPRTVIPWEDMQQLLAKEAASRKMPPEARDEFSSNMTSLLNWEIGSEDDKSLREDAEWYDAPGRQYMEIARTACPPESHAMQSNPSDNVRKAELTYKTRLGGVMTNFNLSTDLCTVGPEIQDKHGFLFSASSISATKRLVPVFGECKISVNSDILFPANMYWKKDERYEYDGTYDVDWEAKAESIIWRGVTSGGVQVPESFQRMHRQRLVTLLNATAMEGQEVRILTEQPEAPGEYENYRQFQPSKFAANYSDVGFVEAWGCFPNCTFLYGDLMEFKPQVTLPHQFKSKYVVDVDGHSFSGRWRAFLKSRSLGIKATIFREWHDSRLFEWRHFVPMDNRFDDIYTILTYFAGIGERRPGEAMRTPHVARHDNEAKRIALQGREWANKVLRNEDIEVSLAKPE